MTGEEPTSSLDEMPPEALVHTGDPLRQLHQYILVEEIGKGGMGRVWKAWDRKLTRWVAIKFLLDQSAEDVRRFEREAKLAARLRHPNIAPVYEVGESPPQQPGQSPTPFLAMEYIDGPILSAVDLPLRKWIELFVQITEGVAAAHQSGVVHRDLKPQNIMLTRAHWPYVMDFGLARALRMESTVSPSGVIMGTPHFMPPEQAQGRLKEIDERSDIYSLGATFYAVLAKEPPFGTASHMQVLFQVGRESPSPLRRIKPEIPPEVEAIIEKAMARDKADRYPSALELAQDLRRYLADEAVLAPRQGPLDRVLGGFGRHPVLGTLGLFTALGLGIWAWVARPKDPVPTPLPEAGARAPREELERFIRNLAIIKSEEHLGLLTDQDFTTLFALPAPSPALAGSVLYEWARDYRPELDQVRQKKSPGTVLLEMARSASTLPRPEGDLAFTAVEPIAFGSLLEAVRRRTERARDARRAEVEELRAEVGRLEARWREFQAKLAPEFQARHPVLAEQERRLAPLLTDFPKDLEELEEINLEKALESRLPEEPLHREEERLRKLAGKAGVTAESRQELYTRLVEAVALQAFFAGRSEEEAARLLEKEGAVLRTLDGPTDPGRFGPRVANVFQLLR
jgi:predicted Ser/Thr protein kinase